MTGIDLDGFWEKFNMALALYKSAGGKMNYEDQLDIVLENINSTFYLDVIRKIRLENKNEEIDSKMFLTAKEALKDHFNATPQNIRNKFKENSNMLKWNLNLQMLLSVKRSYVNGARRINVGKFKIVM